MADHFRTTIEASQDLATIRLKTEDGRLYDIDVAPFTSDPTADVAWTHTTAEVRYVPTYKGIPVPNFENCPYDPATIWQLGVDDALSDDPVNRR